MENMLSDKANALSDRTKNPPPLEKGELYRIIVPFPDDNKSE